MWTASNRLALRSRLVRLGRAAKWSPSSVIRLCAIDSQDNAYTFMNEWILSALLVSYTNSAPSGENVVMQCFFGERVETLKYDVGNVVFV